MYVQTSPHFPRHTGGDNHGQHLWVRAHAHPRRPSIADDDSTYPPPPHDHRKSAGPARGTARAVGRADDGRATDLARGRHPPVGVPSRHCTPRRRDRSTRCANPMRRFFLFFLRARSRPSRARTRRRASVSRRRGWMDGLTSSQPVARNAASGWMGWMTMASRVRARG